MIFLMWCFSENQLTKFGTVQTILREIGTTRSLFKARFFTFGFGEGLSPQAHPETTPMSVGTAASRTITEIEVPFSDRLAWAQKPRAYRVLEKFWSSLKLFVRSVDQHCLSCSRLSVDREVCFVIVDPSALQQTPADTRPPCLAELGFTVVVFETSLDFQTCWDSIFSLGRDFWTQESLS